MTNINNPRGTIARWKQGTELKQAWMLPIAVRDTDDAHIYTFRPRDLDDGSKTMLALVQLPLYDRGKHPQWTKFCDENLEATDVTPQVGAYTASNRALTLPEVQSAHAQMGTLLILHIDPKTNGRNTYLACRHIFEFKTLEAFVRGFVDDSLERVSVFERLLFSKTNTIGMSFTRGLSFCPLDMCNKQDQCLYKA